MHVDLLMRIDACICICTTHACVCAHSQSSMLAKLNLDDSCFYERRSRNLRSCIMYLFAVWTEQYCYINKHVKM